MSTPSILKLKIFYQTLFKKLNRIKSCITIEAKDGGFICSSPLVEEDEKSFSFNKDGWQDSIVGAEGNLTDLVCDIIGLARGSVDADEILHNLGLDIPKPNKLVCSYKKLLELDLPTPETWLGGFIAPGEATLIVALPGVGKTWFTMAIAQVLADGHHALGPWKPKAKKKTLLVDFEMQPNRIRQRLESLRKGYGLENTENSIGILSPDLVSRNGGSFSDLDQKEHIKLLHEAVEDYDLIIIDNVNAAYPASPDDENSPKFWMGPQNLVMGLRQLGKATVMVHHATKGDPKNPAGSGKNTRFFDNVIALCDVTDYTRSDIKKIKVHIRKSRNFPIARETQPELELRDIGSGCYWADTSLAASVMDYKRESSFDLNDDNVNAIPW